MSSEYHDRSPLDPPVRLPVRAGAPPAIAVERLPGATRDAPEVLFCPGFHSSMHGDKARAVAVLCAGRGFGCTRFDYRGHGESSGDAATLTLLDWLDDALAVVDHVPAGGTLVAVGSSMGAWLAVHVALRRPERIGALLLVAAAPDFLQDRLPDALDEENRARLARGLVARLATPSDAAGWPVTEALIESGRALALLTTETAGALRCAVRMLHGTRDDVAPWQRAAALLERVGSDDATLELVRGGDHRLSSPTELVRLERTLDALCRARA